MEDESTTPYWLQSRDALRRSERHRRRSCSSFFLTSGFVVVVLLAIALLLLLVAVPALISSMRRILNPNLLHEGWNCLNLLLVLFAIVCGFLSRNPDDVSEPASARHLFNDSTYSNLDPDGRTSSLIATPSTPIKQIRRNSKSYPDLRQQSDQQWRFLDDTHLNWRSHDPPERILSVDVAAAKSSHLIDSPLGQQSVPSPPSDSVLERANPSPRSDRDLDPPIQSKKKRRGSTKEFFTSLRKKKKKKKQRNKSVDLSETFFGSLHEPPLSSPLTSSAPSLQSHPSFLHGFFSSKKKSRRTNKSKLKNEFTRIKSFGAVEEENVNSGTSSPGICTPLKQPPPPPFGVPEWKFVVEGDFVRVLSFRSSRSGSPDPVRVESSTIEDRGDPKESVSMPFCPSPDVDLKADSFIEMFRAGLRLEKTNSMNEKQGRRLSGLGPCNQSGSIVEPKSSPHGEEFEVTSQVS